MVWPEDSDNRAHCRSSRSGSARGMDRLSSVRRCHWAAGSHRCIDSDRSSDETPVAAVAHADRPIDWEEQRNPYKKLRRGLPCPGSVLILDFLHPLSCCSLALGLYLLKVSDAV
jgi:hypothetical protein